MKVALLTNGPGELWGWARPVVRELRKRGHSVSLWLLPCQFASGYERMVGSQLGVDKLEGPSSSAWTWRALGEEKTDCVLQLGGDLLFGRHIAKRSHAPLLCYAYGPKKGMEHARVFTAYPGMALKMPGARVIGDLVKDSLPLDTGALKWEREERQDAAPRLLLFPGSRPAIRHLSLGWLSAIVQHLKIAVPELQVRTLFSPFVPDNEFPAWNDAGLNPLKIGAGIAMRGADYALTQPGTNTLEMMHCGLPALVAAPMEFLRVVPLTGIGGFASSIPLIGRKIKERGIRRHLERCNGFMAWPNRLANRMILDELTGDVTPQDLAVRIIQSLRDSEKLAHARSELLALSGEHGASSRICDAIDQTVASLP